MTEYIDKAAFKKSVEERYCKPCKADGKDHSGCWCRACWVDDMLDEVECFQPADVAPVVHWILTDAKLPPDGQDVLCWYEYFRFGEYNRMYQTFGIGYQFNGNWGGEVAQGQKAKVLAWMPLPEPPKMDGGAGHG